MCSGLSCTYLVMLSGNYMVLVARLFVEVKDSSSIMLYPVHCSLHPLARLTD